MSDERRCADLIAQARYGYEVHGVTLNFVKEGMYTADEIRVANESLAAMGLDAKVVEYVKVEFE